MSAEAIFSDWSHEQTALFGHHPVMIEHDLHRRELFSDDALADLIECLPRHHYHVNAMSEAGGNGRMWREGQFDGLSGHEVLSAVKNGRIWVSLQRLHEVDARYADVLDGIYAGIETRVRGMKTYKRDIGLLISSPRAQVFYHCDIPGQMLWQLRGRKRVYVYPNRPPFLCPQEMETIVLGEADEEHMPYESWFDNHAVVFDLEPGQMAHWPLNAPHRVENHDCMNVSFTTSHYTDDLRASYAVHYANGILRRWTGAEHLSAQTSGAGLYAKMAFAAFVKYSGLHKHNQRAFRIDFQVDPGSDTGWRDIPAFDLGK